MELSEALNNRKSTRHYIDKKVDKSLLDEMLLAANLAGCWLMGKPLLEATGSLHIS